MPSVWTIPDLLYRLSPHCSGIPRAPHRDSEYLGITRCFDCGLDTPFLNRTAPNLPPGTTIWVYGLSQTAKRMCNLCRTFAPKYSFVVCYRTRRCWACDKLTTVFQPEFEDMCAGCGYFWDGAEVETWTRTVDEAEVEIGEEFRVEEEV